MVLIFTTATRAKKRTRAKNKKIKIFEKENRAMIGSCLVKEKSEARTMKFG